MSRGMTRQRDDLHAVNDRLGATKRVPLAGLDVRRGDGLGGLEAFLCLLWCLGRDFRRQPEVSLRFRNIDFGIGEHSLAIASG